jgi:hypothetical protein
MRRLVRLAQTMLYLERLELEPLPVRGFIGCFMLEILKLQRSRYTRRDTARTLLYNICMRRAFLHLHLTLHFGYTRESRRHPTLYLRKLLQVRGVLHHKLRLSGPPLRLHLSPRGTPLCFHLSLRGPPLHLHLPLHLQHARESRGQLTLHLRKLCEVRGVLHSLGRCCSGTLFL